MQAIRSLKLNQVLFAALASTSALYVAPVMAQTTMVKPAPSSSEVVATETVTEAEPLTSEGSEMPSETPVMSEESEAPVETPVTSEESEMPSETPVMSEESETPAETPVESVPSTPDEITPEVQPPAAEETMPEAAPEATAPVDTSTMTIAELTSSSETFEILTAALEAAELTDELSGEGPFTVFAPTDEAFEALPEGAIETLLAPENKDLLVQILTYHVVPEALSSESLTEQAVTTLEGNDLTVTVEDGIKVNDANVLLADVAASNGIIHVIDQVMIPPELAATLPTTSPSEDSAAVSDVAKPSSDAGL